MTDIKESDWKLLRDMSGVALDRLCDRILKDVAKLAGDPDRGAHARYLAVWKLLKKQDKVLGVAFNDLRRSSAIPQLAHMRRLGLITDDEFARFSEQTRECVGRILEM